ncbi:MAG: MFS transporter [Deltaproteobacteria bacterium]|nr:MFS transporter [Deltaproteobacteria bacterium]
MPVSVKTDNPRFFYGYVIVLVSFALQVLGWGLFNSLGVFFNPIVTEFAWPRAALSSAISFAMLISGATGILQGSLNDRFGPRVIMSAGGVLLGAGYLLMSRVASVWHAYLFCGLMIGMGISGTDIVLLSTTARWFVKRRGMMTGIIKVGTGAGMLCMPLVINGLITAYGWRTAFVVLGAIVLFFYVLGAQFLVRDPGKRGLAPDAGGRVNPLEQPSPEQGLTLGKTARTVQFWTMCFAFFMFLFCAVTILMHLSTHAIDLGITRTIASVAQAALGGTSIAGRFIMGWAGDRIGNKAALVICFICLTASLLWLHFSDTLWMIFLFALVYGFAHGGFFTLISPLTADLFGTSSHGVIFGTITFVFSIGGALGPVTTGYIFDITNSYSAAFWIMAAMSMAGLIAILSLKPIKNA